MHIILYNPLCAKNTGYEKYLKYCKKLNRQKIIYKGYNLLDIIGKEKEFILSLDKLDIIVIIGGDGTLSKVVDSVRGFDVINRVFFLKAGSGNDYARCHKKNFFEITDEIKSYPSLFVNEEEIKFINGVGMGIDAASCHKVNENHRKNIEESYYKTAIKTFKTFKRFTARLNIDGKEYVFNNTWFVAIQNGRYFGGGMKIAPKAKRMDGILDIVVVHRIKLWKLLLIFPTIFLGWHRIFKKSVFMRQGKVITLECEDFSLLQHDGETIADVGKIIIKA